MSGEYVSLKVVERVASEVFHNIREVSLSVAGMVADSISAYTKKIATRST
jgi:hypothetical protein